MNYFEHIYRCLINIICCFDENHLKTTTQGSDESLGHSKTWNRDYSNKYSYDLWLTCSEKFYYRFDRFTALYYLHHFLGKSLDKSLSFRNKYYLFSIRLYL